MDIGEVIPGPRNRKCKCPEEGEAPGSIEEQKEANDHGEEITVKFQGPGRE